MTIQNSARLQKQVSEFEELKRTIQAANPAFENLRTIVQAVSNSASDWGIAVREFNNNLSKLEPFLRVASPPVIEYSPPKLPILDTINKISVILDQYAQLTIISPPTPKANELALDEKTTAELLDSLSDTWEQAAPSLPESAQPKYEEPLISKSKGQRPKRLTLDQLWGLLNLLVPIFFGCLGLLPDKQLDRIIELEEKQIELTEQEIALEKEQLETIRLLQNDIQLVIDHIDLLGDIPQGHDALPKGDSPLAADQNQDQVQNSQPPVKPLQSAHPPF